MRLDMQKTMEKPRLLVFSDDWGRHPSSCQHLVSHLLDACDVSWVNTIGTRPPRLDRTTIIRALEKLSQWCEPPKATGTVTLGPHILNPRMWPSFRRQWSRGLNQWLLHQCIDQTLGADSDCVLLTTLPIVAGLTHSERFLRTVYYCVDDFSQWPGLDGHTLQRMEAELVARCDCVVAAGQNLAERIRDMGRQPTVITHGVDLDHWQCATPQDPLLLREIPRPICMFWGLIDRRLDLEWLQALSDRLQNGSIVLVGPEQDPDSRVYQCKRLVRVGAQPLALLPLLASQADVLIMPYADLPVTRAMQPLKLKEYLATGKPVVGRRLPGVVDWSDCMHAVESAEDFVSRTIASLGRPLPSEHRVARIRLSQESWVQKSQQLYQVLFQRTGQSKSQGTEI